MKREYAFGGKALVLQSGDVALSMYHGATRDFMGRLGAWAITWVPWKRKHLPYSHAMAFGSLEEDAPTLISAERGEVRKVPLCDYMSEKRTIIILRPLFHGKEIPSASGKLEIWELECAGIAAAVGVELEKLAGRRYSKLGILGHGLDTIFTLGGRLTKYRPFAYLLSKADPAVYCSEAVAWSAERACGYRFLRYPRKGTIPPAACRPRDIYWTAKKCGWEPVFLSARGKVLDLAPGIW